MNNARHLSFTVRNSSCGKVMLLHLSVILFTGGSMAGGMSGSGGRGGGRCAWQERRSLQPLNVVTEFS